MTPKVFYVIVYQMVKFLCSVALIFIPAVVFSQTSDLMKEQAGRYRVKGRQLLEADDPQQALVYLQKAIQMMPHCAGCYNEIGRVYEALTNEERATAMYQKALQLNPQYTQVHARLASLYEADGQKREAIYYWKEVYFLSDDGDNLHQTSIYHLLGLLGIPLREKQQLSAIVQRKAKKITKEISLLPQLSKEQAKVYRQTAYNLKALGDFEQSLAYYQKALAMNPYYFEVYNEIGLVYEALNKREDAIRTYKHVISLNPSYLAPYANLALLYEQQNDYKRALTYWKRRFLLGSDKDFWTKQAFVRLVELLEIYPNQGSKF